MRKKSRGVGEGGGGRGDLHAATIQNMNLHARRCRFAKLYLYIIKVHMRFSSSFNYGRVKAESLEWTSVTGKKFTADESSLGDPFSSRLAAHLAP